VLTKSTVLLYSLNSGQLHPYTTRDIDVLQHSAPASPLLGDFFPLLFPQGGCLCFSLSAFPASNCETSKELVHNDDEEVRAYPEQKSHTAVMRIWGRRIAKLAVKRKAWPSTSETLGAPRRLLRNTAPIHTPTRCGPRGGPVSEMLSPGTE
jgi:hypothetical protein